MKVEMLNEEDMDVFINKFYFNQSYIRDKDDLLVTIRDIIQKMDVRYHLNLKGFYKIKAYINQKIGAFLNIIKIDDNEFTNEVDFRIIIFRNERFLLETEEYDVVSENVPKIYYHDKFYIDIEDLDNYNKYFDMVRVIYGDEVKEVLAKGKKIKEKEEKSSK